MSSSTRSLRLFLVAAALIPLLLVAGATLLLGVDVPKLTRDTAAIAGIHPLAGFLSNLGILFWWTSASIWFFSAILFKQLGLKEYSSFALSSSLLSAYITLDDFFQIHEKIAPWILGITEEVVYAALGLITAFYLWKFRSIIFKRGFLLLILAIGLLSSSVATDVLLKTSLVKGWVQGIGGWTFFIEDGLKWLGITCWCAYCVTWCRSNILANFSRDTKSLSAEVQSNGIDIRLQPDSSVLMTPFPPIQQTIAMDKKTIDNNSCLSNKSPIPIQIRSNLLS